MVDLEPDMGLNVLCGFKIDDKLVDKIMAETVIVRTLEFDDMALFQANLDGEWEFFSRWQGVI
jgi:hypothetical protein